MDEERWARIPGTGFYEASTLGQIRSVDRVVEKRSRTGASTYRARIKGVILRPTGGKQPKVNIYGRRVIVAHLILETFRGPRPPGMMALHWNDVDSDNRLENLRWGTESENRRDAVRNRRHGYARRTHCKWDHEYTPENTRIRVRANGVKERVCLKCERSRHGTTKEGK